MTWLLEGLYQLSDVEMGTPLPLITHQLHRQIYISRGATGVNLEGVEGGKGVGVEGT